MTSLGRTTKKAGVLKSNRHVCYSAWVKYLGNVYEKPLLEAYLHEHQTDPVTNEPATVEDYIELKGAWYTRGNTLTDSVPEIARPSPANLTSLPSLLAVFQSEWDSLALETFTLRKQLLETRQELSTALYQHDAACRVIARLQKDRDEAREALSKLSIVDGTQKHENGEAMEIDEGPASVLPPVIARQIIKAKEEYLSFLPILY